MRYVRSLLKLISVSMHYFQTCWFIHVAYISSSFCCVLYSCVKTKSDVPLCL